jgi:integrase
MGRKQTLIIYPHLNDAGGDLSKDWYIEFKYRVPGNPNLIKERIYKGLQVGKADDRYSLAAKIITDKRKWLDDGGFLKPENKTRVYVDELEYNSVTRLYGKIKSELPTIRQNISEYLTFIKQQKTAVTYSNIQTKLRTFVAYLVTHKLDVDVRTINRKHIIDFLVYLSNDLKLSRATLKDYKQAVANYFDYEIDCERININPVVRMPLLGQIVDCAAVPFTVDEKLRMKELIKKHDPQLWLACQIQYYCAIRPGHELRLMRVGWIDFDKHQFRVPNEIAKNGETEIVEIPDILFTELVETYNLKSFDKNLFVFGSAGVPGASAYGKNTLRNRFNKYRDKLNIAHTKVFYSWKHSGAIDLIENGLQPYNLQEHLRHKNFDTTERYLKKRIKGKEKSINKFVTAL